MATTTNFGWTTPDDTDLVKDGAAAIRTLGSSIDSSLVDLNGGTTGQVLAKASDTDLDFTFVSPSASPLTTKGDLYTYSTVDTRLAVGANGTVLTADSVESTGLKWVTPATPTTSYTLVNAGGTALTGATSVTVSGISGKNKLMVYIQGASSANAGSIIQFRLNSDSGSNYGQYFYRITGDSSYNDDIFTSFNAITQTELILAKMSGTAGSQVNGYVCVDGANSTTRKVITSVGGGNENGNTGHTLVSSGAYYDGSSTISSFTLISNSGNFDAGTLFVYGA
jgi:hypothetical protein